MLFDFSFLCFQEHLYYRQWNMQIIMIILNKGSKTEWVTRVIHSIFITHWNFKRMRQPGYNYHLVLINERTNHPKSVYESFLVFTCFDSILNYKEIKQIDQRMWINVQRWSRFNDLLNLDIGRLTLKDPLTGLLNM